MCAVEMAYIGLSVDNLKTYQIEEKSYNPDGQIFSLTSTDLKNGSPALEMAMVCSLNSTAKIVKEEGKYKRQGEPTEAALLVGAEKIGKIAVGTTFDVPMPYHEKLQKQIEKIGVLEFSSERKTMSTIVKGLKLEGKAGN
jgi:magnesium-transporting ATPase (P-type)